VKFLVNEKLRELAEGLKKFGEEEEKEEKKSTTPPFRAGLEKRK